MQVHLLQYGWEHTLLQVLWSVHAGFDSRVSSFTGSTDSSPHGRDIQDPSGFVRDHIFQCFAGAVECRRQIGSQQTIPFVISHVDQKSDMADTGIVDQYI